MWDTYLCDAHVQSLIKNVRMRNALEPVPMWYEYHEMSYGWYLCGVRRHKRL